MNQRFFKDKITIFHFEKDESIIRQEYSKVYFRHNKKINTIDKGIEKGAVGTVIIPTTSFLNINTDDYLIEGIVKEEFDLFNLIKKYQVFKILSVDDNRKGELQHFKLGVGE